MPTHPPSSTHGLDRPIDYLEGLAKTLKGLPNAKEKSAFLSRLPRVSQFIHDSPWLMDFESQASSEQCFALYSLIAIGEGPVVLRGYRELENPLQSLHRLMTQLAKIEAFYRPLGGIVGYQLTVLKLIRGDVLETPQRHYLKPPAFDLRQDTPALRSYVLEGIRRLPEVAEMYPVGGAGDRLNLYEEQTGKALPAALLRFGSGYLFDWLIRDLQAREYLYFKLFDKQIVTPIALMTSEEKDNEKHIKEILEDRKWYGRPKDSFFLFTQPRVPVVTEEGHWSTLGPLDVLYKPGGHGPIWKLAQDSGALKWLTDQGIRKILVRQINNPLAGVDNGLLAFTGLGLMKGKRFGFASCDRVINASEGMNVLVENQTPEGVKYCITNVEYTEFAKHGLKDIPATAGSLYSVFPANTNILFADIKAIEDTLRVCPLPGLLVNMKSQAPFIDAEGNQRKLPAGRLEGTMQNIADHMEDSQLDSLSSYLTFNERHKTLSVTKNLYKEGASPLGTPQSCFYDLMLSYRELLVNHCALLMPDIPPLSTFIRQFPPYLVHIHPALGPLYTIIGQKIRGGSLALGSHLVLEIAELELLQLHLDGSLQIIADRPMGHVDGQGLHRNSLLTGKCILRNVSVANRGVDVNNTDQYWNAVTCHESLMIRLHGSGEFFAEDVVFNGSHLIEVADKEKVTAYNDAHGSILLRHETLASPSWYWSYSTNPKNQLIVTKSGHTQKN